jgi:hypothetical protein
MRIEEVEEILGLYRLPIPAHVFITNEFITNGGIFLGLQPKERGDVIVLGRGATPETVIHETLHCLGLGEELAYPLGRLLVTKYYVLKKFPLLKQLMTLRTVKYEKPKDWGEFEKVRSKYEGRIEYYRYVPKA